MQIIFGACNCCLQQHDYMYSSLIIPSMDRIYATLNWILPPQPCTVAARPLLALVLASFLPHIQRYICIFFQRGHASRRRSSTHRCPRRHGCTSPRNPCCSCTDHGNTRSLSCTRAPLRLRIYNYRLRGG